ncbi:hypothetical protein ENSA5_32410 [Enhygromyxa salina]|uniref:Cytochrome c domain-containing protein n=1 Tax=Enhygromyxa salina TaxID=215803 RepID=A0A2S9XXF2_9BACT|nr:hypothetical protein [Enhygromyxa salina]PRP97548.1 hypothetical protein ENSA5_32410 [Enhygromyxa salina]
MFLVLGLACQRDQAEPQAKPKAEAEAKTEAEAKPTAQPTAEALPPSARTTPPQREPRTPLAPTMNAHFAHAAQLEQAVIDGDLEAVALHAEWLVNELPKQEMPEAWQPQLERMQAAAAQAAKAQTLAEAGPAAARVVETCGACHQSIGKGPTLPDPPPVPEGDDTAKRMLRHQWAASRMREAMISGSDERWKLGAGAVSVAPPEPCPIPDAEILDADTLALREKIYEIGAKALAAAPSDRTALYGEYLTTCAGCHVGGC